jgi:hypothetical protein
MIFDRRLALKGGIAAGIAALSTGTTSAAVAGKLTDEQFNLMSGTARTPAEYRRLAVHFRAIAAEHEAEAKAWEEIAGNYKKRLPAGTVQSQADDIYRDLRHAAEHSRDTAQAVIYVAEAYEGMADHFRK